MSQIDTDSYTIASGQSLSPQINLGDKALHGLFLPSGWSGTSISFQASPDGGGTWFEFYDVAGGTATYTVAAGEYIALDPNKFAALNCLKLRSGSVGSPTNQAGNATFIVVSKRKW